MITAFPSCAQTDGKLCSETTLLIDSEIAVRSPVDSHVCLRARLAEVWGSGRLQVRMGIRLRETSAAISPRLGLKSVTVLGVLYRPSPAPPI